MPMIKGRVVGVGVDLDAVEVQMLHCLQLLMARDLPALLDELGAGAATNVRVRLSAMHVTDELDRDRGPIRKLEVTMLLAPELVKPSVPRALPGDTEEVVDAEVVDSPQLEAGIVHGVHLQRPRTAPRSFRCECGLRDMTREEAAAHMESLSP